jgi:predicted permease
MLQDLRFGLKLLWKEKAFSLTALLMLALCIGANTAIFTVLYAVILRPLPFPESERLVTMYNVYPGVGVTDRGANSAPDYPDRRGLTEVFEDVTMMGNPGFDVGSEGSPQRISGESVTPSYFRVLRAGAALGRTFTEEESVTGEDRVAVLSHSLWRDLFGADPNVTGKDIRLSGVPHRIVGVMPDGFAILGRETKIWVPLAFTPQQLSDDGRHSNNWGMIARLKPGVTVAYAQRRIDELNQRNIERFPKFRKLLEDARFGTKVVGLQDEFVKSIRPTLYLLQAAVGLVLLIGCVNIANLMLVRANVRMKELAVRHSLGAGRWRIGRQLLTESVTLALLGGLLGVAVGFAGVRLLNVLGGDDLPRHASIAIDGTVMAFSAGIAILTGLVFGSAPVIHLFKRDLIDAFRGSGRTGTAERRAMWTRSALVVSQVSLAFVLLIGAGLLLSSFARLLSVNPGFRAENVFTARFSLPRTRYSDDARARNFVTHLLDTVRRLPGVKGAGVTSYLPFSGSNNASVIMIDGYVRSPGENPPVPGWNHVDSGYFQAIGIPLLRGRAFAESDGPDSQRVVLIDQFLERKFWPKGNAIGATIRRGVENNEPPWTVAGVVGSIKVGDLAEQNPVGQIYFHYPQTAPRTMHLVIKTDKDDPSLMTAIRQEMSRADPELPLFDVKTMPERLAASLVNRRAAMLLCLIFAALAVALSAIGLYGILAYTVTQRTREFGIRVALGAGARDVLGMVISQGLKLAGAGVVLGLAAGLALAQLMTVLLFEVKPTDLAVFLGVAFTLSAVALIASLIPSLRAMRIRPAVALRDE